MKEQAAKLMSVDKHDNTALYIYGVIATGLHRFITYLTAGIGTSSNYDLNKTMIAITQKLKTIKEAASKLTRDELISAYGTSNVWVEIINTVHANKVKEAEANLLLSADVNGNTALHVYSEEGDSNGITQLLGAADRYNNLKTLLTVKNEAGDAALHIAIANKNSKAIEAILAQLFSSQDKELLSSVLFDRNRYGTSALEFMISRDFADNLIELAKSVGKLNDILLLKDINGRTVLHFAVLEGKQSIIEKICKIVKQDKVLQRQVLLAQDVYDKTPLHWATDYDDASLMNHLIS